MFRPPYSEETYPHPVNTYGRSKLRAEHAALAAHPTATVLRVPVLYGKTTLLSESAITSLVSKVKNREHCQEDHYCVRLPTYVDDVSKVLLELFKRCADAAVANGVSTHVAASVLGMDGHLHWSNVERFTKYEICQLIGRIMGTSTEHISPKTDTPPSTGAVRPKGRLRKVYPQNKPNAFNFKLVSSWRRLPAQCKPCRRDPWLEPKRKSDIAERWATSCPPV